MAQNDVILTAGVQLDPASESKLQQSFAKIEKNMKFTTPFSSATRNVRDFNSELDRANQRVITLGASFAVLSASIRIFKDIVTATVSVEKALLDINSVFQLSTKSMEQFSRGLFDVSRETSQSFEKTAEAAKEFSRQGLGATEVLKRTRDAMVLTRLASLSAEEAVSTLTASINGFQKAALDSTQIINKLATVDARFAVSSKDLAQGLARAGAAASDAGVDFNQLIGLITAAQQTTARGGAVIGNSLKTIFTRIERKDTIEAFEALGVAVTDLRGNVLPAMGLLQNFANVYDKLGGSVKKQAAELVGGVYQINILKALLADMSKGANSVATQAAETSANAADEAIRRNEALNKSLSALAQQAATTYQQIGSKVGGLGLADPAKGLLDSFANGGLTKAFANAGETDANSLGEHVASGFIKGFGNAVIFGLGPFLISALSQVAAATIRNIQKDFVTLTNTNKISAEQRTIQSQIVDLYNSGDTALKRQIMSMGTLAERAALVEGILSRTSRIQSGFQADVAQLGGAVAGIRKTPRAAGGYDPFSAESAAIRAGVGGAGSGAKPVMIPNFAFGGGMTGPIVANTSEWVVKKGGASAIYNPMMIQKMGLPPGATPIAAGGYIPNMAFGGMLGMPGMGSPFDYPQKMLKNGNIVPAGGVSTASGQGFGQYLPGQSTSVLMGQQTGHTAYAPGQAVAAMGEAFGSYAKTLEHLLMQSSKELKSALNVHAANSAIMGLGTVTPYGPMPSGTLQANQAIYDLGKVESTAAYRKRQAMEAKMIGLPSGGQSGVQYVSAPWSGKPYQLQPTGTSVPDELLSNSYFSAPGLREKQRLARAAAAATAAETSAMPGPGRFGRVGDYFKSNPMIASIGTSMGLSFAGGALPSFFSEASQRGGTGSGMAIGGLSSGLSYAGTGAGIGSMFGLPGMGIGAGIGFGVGALTGSLGKMTKSFEELSQEISVVNEKIRMQFENASEVAKTQAQISELLSSDQSPNEIQRSVSKLRSSLSTNLSKVENPRVKSLLESGDPEDLKEAMSLLNEGGVKRSISQDMISATKGALDTSVGNMGGAFGYKNDSSERIAKALAPFLAGKSSREVAKYSKDSQSDPISTLKSMLLDAGVDQKTINESFPDMRMNLGIFDGYEETRSMFGGAISKAVSGEVANRNRRPEILKRQESRAKRMSGLRAISEAYKGQSEFAQIRSSSDLQIGGVEQQIALGSPLLLDTERLAKQGAFGIQNIRAQSAGLRQSQLLSGKSSLSDVLISKGGDSDEIRKLIDGLSGLGSIKDLVKTLESPEGILKAGISGAGTPDFKKALMDLQRSMEKLDDSENEQIRVGEETNRLMLNQLNFTKSYAGARAEYGGAARSAGANLVSSLNRFDTPDILLKNIGESNLTGLNDEYNRSKGGMSRYEYQGRKLGISANVDGSTRSANGAAIRYLLNNPSAMGAKDLTGSQVTSGLLNEAEGTGRDGKSLKSMSDGFTAVFAGMKKDMSDLSKLGANLGQSLSSSLSGAFGDFVTGAKSGKDAFRSFAVSVLGDASRMFASQAIQGILGSMFGGVSPTLGRANGGPIPFAAGGKVPAMLTGGEYYIGPNAAKKIGYDTLHRLNKYADGGMVRGGSGVKDDVPAKLAPGSFIIKKSAVGKLGPDYLDSLVGGKVQHRFFGGLLMGAVMGGAIGYATGGKKGALIGAIGGGIAGGLAQNFGQTGNLLKSDAGAGMFQFSPSAAASGPQLSFNAMEGVQTGGAAQSLLGNGAKAAMPMWQKAAIGLGASALLGGVSSMLTPKDPKFTPMNSTQITANRKRMEAEQNGMSTPEGLYPWLSPNPNGGMNQMGFVLPPTRRMYANGGMVGNDTVPLFMSEGGAVGPVGSVDSGMMSAASSRSGGGAANVSVKIEINNNGSTSSSASSDNKDSQGGFGANFAEKLQKQVQGIVQQELVNQSRSDGFFTQKGRFVQGR